MNHDHDKQLEAMTLTGGQRAELVALLVMAKNGMLDGKTWPASAQRMLELLRDQRSDG